MNRLDLRTQETVLSGLVEGASIRTVERITGVHRDTITRLMVRVGTTCAQVLDEHMRDLACERIEGAPPRTGEVWEDDSLGYRLASVVQKDWTRRATWATRSSRTGSEGNGPRLSATVTGKIDVREEASARAGGRTLRPSFQYRPVSLIILGGAFAVENKEARDRPEEAAAPRPPHAIRRWLLGVRT